MRHIESVKKAIVFTDIKDFTLKSSLLTGLQVREFLNEQDSLVIPIIKKYNGNLFKALGDSYMIVFDDVTTAIKAAIDIQKILKTYNSKVKFNLNKIELRIIINYGDIQKEKTILGEDYFGDIINIVSRLQHEVNENKIFATSSVIEKLKEKTNLNNKFSYKYLGETILRGILYKIGVYEVFYDGKENSECTYKKNIILLSPELQKTLKDAGSFVFEYSFLASIIGIQNIIPFGTYIIFPLHLYLLKKVANRFGIFDLKGEIGTIFLTVFYSLISIFLISYLPIYINDLEITGYKLHILIILLNFCFTYVLGKCFVFYFFRKSQGIENINKEIKNMLKKQS